jgi:peptide/nickel transport system permease protein
MEGGSPLDRGGPLPTRSVRAWIGLGIVLGFTLAGLAAPAVNRHVLGQDCHHMPKLERPLVAPGPGHPLGTDSLGRDLLARLLCGARTSLAVGFGAESLALLLGVAIGAWAGYAGGRTDAWMMRFTDIVLAFPFPLVAVAVVGLARTDSLLTVVLLLGALGWPAIARLVRARLLSLREAGFVAAARAAGAGRIRVMIRHALPAALAPAWAVAAVGIGSNILAEAWLAFIGLGDPGRVSWGTILRDAKDFASTSTWWFPLFPGLFISITILGFMLLGDALQEGTDPHAATELP